MKSLCIALMIWAFSTQAQNVAPLVVDSLYDSKSRMPGILIPFRVKGAAMATGTLLGATVTSNNGTDCRIMKDPFLLDVFHLKCVGETQVVIEVQAVSENQGYQVSYGPLDIKLPAGGFTVVQPIGPDPNILLGKSLFNSHCIGCHNPAVLLADKTAAQINSSLQSVPIMAPLRTIIKSADVLKLEAYLKSL